MRRVVALLAAALLTATALAACGGSGAEPGASSEATPARAATPATLVLDFQPNAVHSGIYAAQAEGDYDRAGIDLTVRQPSSSADSAKLLEAGRAQFAILDIHDLGLAREKGLDVVGIAPVVRRPLASVLARSDRVTRPRDLEGKRVGVTGVPSDDAVLDSIVSADGGDPSKVERITIGFNAISALAAGKVDAATAFWNAEGVTLKGKGVPIAEFRVDDYGAPAYPELVMATSRKLIDSDPDLVKAMATATAAGYGRAIDDPAKAERDLLAAVSGLDPAETHAEMQALTDADAFTRDGFDRASLEAWAKWDTDHGLLGQTPDISQTFYFGR
jgi:putative hydroxymethylpyrimidine transport system substrate-binding protein